MASRARNRETILKLTKLLRDNGDEILSGGSKLSLTTSCLIVLHEGFSNITDTSNRTSFDVLPTNNAKLPMYQELLFLYDFVQKTLALKIIHGSCTLQGRIVLTPFRSLQTLEIKKTPIHLIEGIQRLRGQLKTIICSRCLSALQDLFETCGGDMSRPMSWSELSHAYLSYNSIDELDCSLRFLPVLEVLDLGHNYIQDTEKQLEYLTELVHLNLGYNRLESVPTFSYSTRTKLQTLVLKHNNLDNIDGVEELVNLVELDMSSNCLCDHDILVPLRNLSYLRLLKLADNPIAHHDTHRLSTIQYLSAAAVQKVILDGQPVTKAEYAHFKKMGTVSSVGRRSQRGATERQLYISDGDQSCDSTSTHTDTDPILQVATSSGRKGRRGSKAKKKRRAYIADATISDISTTSVTDNSSQESSRAGTPVAKSYLQVRDEMETRRGQLGPHWLQTLSNDKALSHSLPRETEDDIYLNEPDASINAFAVDVEIHAANLSSPESSDQVTEGKSKSGEGETGEDKNTEKVLDVVNKHTHVNAVDSLNGASEVTRVPVDSGDGCDPVDVSAVESDPVINWQRQDSDTQVEEDLGPESEPFIVQLSCEDDQHVLVSLTEKYLLEKDLDGRIIEKLDIGLLQSIVTVDEAATEAAEMDTGQDVPVVKLTFDYVRKDRRERMYIMEDQENAQHLHDLLYPVIEAKEMAALLKDMFQCLKCSKEFKKTDAVSKTLQSSLVATLETNSFSSSLGNNNKSVDELISCPYCKSEMVVEMEPDSIARARHSTSNTPIGSFSSALATTPQATSSAQVSPYKPRELDPKEAEQYYKLTNISASWLSGDSDNTPNVASNGTLSDMDRSSNGTPNNKAPHIRVLDFSNSSNDKKLDSKKVDKQIIGENVLSQKLEPEEIAADAVSMDTATTDELWTTCDGQESSTDEAEVMPVRTQSLTPPSDKRGTSRDSTSSSRDLPRRTSSSNLRKRHDSIESDITILSNPSQSSIAVIAESNSEIMAARGGFEHKRRFSSGLDELNKSPPLEKSVSLDEGAMILHGLQPHSLLRKDMADSQGTIEQLSPCGSLTSSTCTDIVNSLYENSIYEGKNGKPLAHSAIVDAQKADTISVDSFKSIPDAGHDDSFLSTEGMSIYDTDPTSIPGDNANGGDASDTPDTYSLEGHGDGQSERERCGDESWTESMKQVDHRLKLFLMMSVFDDDTTEEFELILRCCIVRYMVEEEFEGILVVSSRKIYILQVKGKEGDQPADYLKCIDKQPITELQYVDIGLGQQSFRLEFEQAGSSYSLLLRDELKCKAFLGFFTALIQGSAFSNHSKLQAISKTNPETLENVRSQVLHGGGDQDALELSIDDDEDIVKFTLGFLLSQDATGVESGDPVSIVLTPSLVCLARENHQWPLPRLQAPLSQAMKSTQFLLHTRQKINEIAHLDLYDDAPCLVGIEFFNEESSEECRWLLRLESVQGVQGITASIQQPWQREFGIELQINQWSTFSEQNSS